MNVPIYNGSKSVSKIHKTKYKAYCFGSLCHLNHTTLDTLINIFQCEPNNKPGRLEGRVVPQFTSIPEAGPVVVKSYKRGGLLSRINKDTYLKIFNIRSRKEFEFLLHAGKAGVTVPTPVAFASRGYPFYKAWLITKEITDHISFAQLCFTEKEKALNLIPEISRNIRLLIQNSIHHVDLHLGNIIIDKNYRNYIVDFDKAHYFNKNKLILAMKYQKRWSKAIKKYSLPDIFADLHLTED